MIPIITWLWVGSEVLKADKKKKKDKLGKETTTTPGEQQDIKGEP